MPSKLEQLHTDREELKGKIDRCKEHIKEIEANTQYQTDPVLGIEHNDLLSASDVYTHQLRRLEVRIDQAKQARQAAKMFDTLGISKP